MTTDRHVDLSMGDRSDGDVHDISDGEQRETTRHRRRGRGRAGPQRRRRGQARAGRYRASGGLPRTAKDRVLRFCHGAQKTLAKVAPATEAIVEEVERRARLKVKSKSATEINSSAEALYEAQREETEIVREMVSQWTQGGHGYIPEDKPDNVLRLSVENANSMSIYHPENWKVKKCCSINNRYGTDGTLLAEGGVNWAQAPEGKRPSQLFRGARKCRVAAGYNVHESGPEFGRYQHGGTLAAAFTRLTPFVLGTGEDRTGLGRWSWVYVGTEGRKTRLISAYQPCRSPEDKKKQRRFPDGTRRKRMTVWAQHRRYFRKRGIFHNPRSMFSKQLVAQLRQWRAAGDELILYIDANEHLYDGNLAQILQGDGLCMEEQVLASTGQQAPYSHARGSTPISGTYATPGIHCQNSYVAPHGTGVGDHRLQIHDFCATSVLGIDYPTLVRPEGRRLRCDVEKSVKNYNKVLKQLYLRHRVFEKFERIDQNYDTMTAAEFQLELNRWDREVVEYKRCAESKCNKKYDGTIPFSDEVGVWFNRLRIYRWMARFKEGRVKDPRNLFRQCKRHGVPQPRELSPEDVAAREASCLSELASRRQRAPELRVRFLRERLDDAIAREDEESAAAIRRILRKEAIRKRWRNIQSTVQPDSGGAVTRLMVPTSAGPSLFSTKEGVEQQAAIKMQTRFRLARVAPICTHEQLHRDFGFLGDSEAVRQVLEGRYQFPPDIDKYTKLLLEEAHHLFARMSVEEVSDFVTTEDFQEFWSRANEDIQSSESKIHFGHYKAISRDVHLSSLEAAKLSLCARTGIPLDRWGNGLTVLLEKVFGNIFIDKMRAICLLEADYNWLNKLVFAKRMMKRAREEGIVPLEQFAKSGCEAAEGVLATGFFCDIARTLHRTAGVESVDLANCYDSVAHPIANIAMQSFKVRAVMVSMMLSVLQTMNFFLRTGFGQSQESHGGTKDDPTMGLAQGNGAAPPGFLAVSTLMIDVYKRLGHGTNFVSAWTGDVFYLAAVLYVDDSDLLHLSMVGEPEDEEFLSQVQEATFDWGGLVQATGGSLKPAKCFWYMLAWRWVQGKPMLKKLSKLPTTPLMIPQPDGTTVPIVLKDPHDAAKKLGVWTCPSGDFGVHVKEMVKKGEKWASRMRAGHCPPRDAWLGLRHQLWRKMSYGLVAVSHPPHLLEKAVQSVWYKCLPFLRVNRCITKEWRMLPFRFQGLSLPHVNIELLGRKIHLLQRHWGSHGVTGRFLRHAFEAFQVETGLGGNIFLRDYDRLGVLATDGWFKNLWQLCHLYGVKLELCGTEIPLLRKGDSTVMDDLARVGIFSDMELIRLNRVRKFKKIHSLGDSLLADGITVCPSVLTTDAGESTRAYPIERPTRRDFKLWRESLRVITSVSYKLRRPLGPYVAKPHRPDQWFTNEARDELYFGRGDGTYDVFVRDDSGARTRYGAYYSLLDFANDEVTPTRRASIVPALTPQHVKYHSSSPLPPPAPRMDSVVEVLHSWGDRRLWSNLRIDGDGSWIRRGMIMGTLAVGHDGSYKCHVAKDVCAGAVAMECQWTGHRAECAWTEQTTRYSATNYRGEALGGIIAQLILRAATEGHQMPKCSTVQCGCDNLGIVGHGNKYWEPLKESQSQHDVLRILKRLVSTATVRPTLFHVYGHQDDYLREDQLDINGRLNKRADSLAGEDLVRCVASGQFIPSHLPFDDVHVKVGASVLTGSPTQAILNHWGHGVAKDLFHSRGIVDRRVFNLVYWDGVESAMKRFPDMFRTWVTKHVSHFCGTNRHLSRIDDSIDNVCPSCGRRDESTSHMTRCRSEGRTLLFRRSVSSIVEWLESVRTDPGLIYNFEEYLRARGRRTMKSIVGRKSPYFLAATIHDRLGWDNFVEGRLCSLWLEHREVDIAQHGLRSTAESWGRDLIHRLLELTHRQWIYRNTAVHFVAEGGLTLTQHRTLMNEIESYAGTDPEDLLPENRHLLDVDFEALGEGATLDRSLWLAEMKTATAAAAHVSRGTTQALRSRYCTGPRYDTRRTTVPVGVDTEGSIRWRRRRRR